MSCRAATTLGHVGLRTRMHGGCCAIPLQMQAMPPTFANKHINQCLSLSYKRGVWEVKSYQLFLDKSPVFQA